MFPILRRLFAFGSIDHFRRNTYRNQQQYLVNDLRYHLFRTYKTEEVLQSNCYTIPKLSKPLSELTPRRVARNLRKTDYASTQLRGSKSIAKFSCPIAIAANYGKLRHEQRHKEHKEDAIQGPEYERSKENDIIDEIVNAGAIDPVDDGDAQSGNESHLVESWIAQLSFGIPAGLSMPSYEFDQQSDFDDELAEAMRADSKYDTDEEENIEGVRKGGGGEGEGKENERRESMILVLYEQKMLSAL